MHAHLQHITDPVSIGRIYLPGHSFDARDPYLQSFVIRWQSASAAELMAVDKPMDAETMRAIRETIIAHGIGTLHRNRHGRMIPKHYPITAPTLPPHPHVQ